MTLIPAVLRPGSDPLEMKRDFENKLIAADTDNDSMDDIFYKFDALGRRVGRDDGTANVVYFQDGQQTIATYPSGTVTYTYVYASYIEEPVMRGGSDGLRYYHRNQQYSITAVSDGGGSVVERYAYSAYGQVTIADASGSVISDSAVANRYTYTGREWDEGLSLYHFRARMYDAVGGRFVSRDPIGFEGGINIYRAYFVPKTSDPSGEVEFEEDPSRPYFPSRPRPRPRPTPATLLAGVCAGVANCKDCDPAKCAVAQAEFETAIGTGNAAAIGTVWGFVEERGLGTYGGRCHYWSAVFLDNCKSARACVTSCLDIRNTIIQLDGNKKWKDHNINIIKNRCTGKCIVVDDGFWGALGPAYDPCSIQSPPLVGPIGQAQWDNEVRRSCGC